MNYWIIVDDHHDGPYSGRQLVDNGLQPETLVWTEGLPDWTPASEIAELAAMLENRTAASAHEPIETAGVAATDTQAESEPEPLAETPAEAEVEIEVVEAPVVEPVRPVAETTAQETISPAPTAQSPSPAAVSAVEPCPPAYIAWSVIVTVLCCTIVGIPAIVFSSMTKSAYYRGDLERSKRYSELAQWFIIAAIVLGAVSWPFQIAFMGMF